MVVGATWNGHSYRGRQPLRWIGDPGDGMLALAAEALNRAVIGGREQFVEAVVVVEDGARCQPGRVGHVA